MLVSLSCLVIHTVIGQQVPLRCMCAEISVQTSCRLFSRLIFCSVYPPKDPGGTKQLWESEEAGQKIWIVDTFPYNGEMVAELRLKHLFRDVDEFIVVESRMTHSGKKKDFLYVERDWKSFEPYLSKVRAHAATY